MDERLKKKLVYASAFSLAAMLVIVSIFSISLKNITVSQASKISNLTHTYYIQSTNLTQTSNEIAQLEANISNLTNKLNLLESKSNSFSVQENLSKSNITAYQTEVNSLNIRLSQLNNSYNTAESLYRLADRSLSYSLSKLSADNSSIFNLSSVLVLKNQRILNLSSNISKLKSSLASDSMSLSNLSSELALKNQAIANLSAKLNNESKYIYEENFIPSKIASMKLNYPNSTIRSIAQNGSNISVVGNRTDPGYFVIIHNVNSGKNTNLTGNFINDSIKNVFSSVSNGKGFTFLVKFNNSSIGLVEYNNTIKNLTNITSFNSSASFYSTGLSYSGKGYLITGYSKVNTPPSKISGLIYYYNTSNDSVINLSSKLKSFVGYNFTNSLYNGTNYYLISYTIPPGLVNGIKLDLLSYNPNTNKFKNISNLTLPITNLVVGSTISKLNISLSWNGAYFLVSGSYLITVSSTLPSPSPSTHTPPTIPPTTNTIINIHYYSFLGMYNPATKLWTNLSGSLNLGNKEGFTSNMLWNGSSFITALSNSSGSGLYSLNN